MGELVLIFHILHSDVVVGVLLHQLLRWGEALGGSAGSCFGCHVEYKPFRVDQRVLRRRWVEEIKSVQPIWRLQEGSLGVSSVQGKGQQGN
jgi:hypothetical protein